MALMGLGAAAYWLWERRKTWAAVMAGSIVVGASLGIADARAGLPFKTAEILLAELGEPISRSRAISYVMGASDVGQDRIHCAADEFDGTVFFPELEKALAAAPGKSAAGLVVLAVMAKLHPCGKQEVL